MLPVQNFYSNKRDHAMSQESIDAPFNFDPAAMLSNLNTPSTSTSHARPLRKGPEPKYKTVMLKVGTEQPQRPLPGCLEPVQHYRTCRSVALPLHL
jgi:hypothetical protein